ncbi:MAG: type 4a pilus biogenesis protein PilO [Patescibacteria group bacterium]|nr:type 4a pilus biogenesis protein PilO [Patescibacteria group bacterium]MDE2144828.1 type 4a pilus biogenesis protein PilO [Patescibacteria group bacterium]
MSKEFKRKLTTQIVITGAALAVIAVLLFYLGRKISSEANKIYTIRTQNALIASDVARISNLRNQAAEAGPYLTKLSAALPTKANVYTLSNTINAIALKDGVNVGFRFGAEGQKSSNNLNYVDFEISVQGSYDNIAKFVEDTENGGYYLTIDNISLVEGGNGLGGVINGKIYFYDNGTGQSQ